MLVIKNLIKRFGGITALNGVSINVKKGEILGLIGPNGSGKTTLLNVVSGVYRRDEGEIYLDGKRIDGLPPHEIVSYGVFRTFQIPKIFGNMTVLENMIIPVISDAFNGKLDDAREKALELLELVQLKSLSYELAKNLSGGQKMLLQIARGLMVEKLKLYLLDEPFAGVNPAIKELIQKVLKEENTKKKITIIIVSHELTFLREFVDKMAVMAWGKIIAEGTLEEISENPRVIEAYLG